MQARAPAWAADIVGACAASGEVISVAASSEYRRRNMGDRVEVGGSVLEQCGAAFNGGA